MTVVLRKLLAFRFCQYIKKRLRGATVVTFYNRRTPKAPLLSHNDVKYTARRKGVKGKVLFEPFFQTILSGDFAGAERIRSFFIDFEKPRFVPCIQG